MFLFCYTLIPVVEVALEDSSISVDEGAGTYEACVSKDRETVSPVQLDIVELGQGSATTAVGELSGMEKRGWDPSSLATSRISVPQ